MEEGGRRLADEIKAIVAARQGLTDITLVGNSLGAPPARSAKLPAGRGFRSPLAVSPGRSAHVPRRRPSAGGLYCRFAMALLLDGENRIHGLTPRTFLTTATPHLGARAAPLHSRSPRLSRPPVRRPPAALR